MSNLGHLMSREVKKIAYDATIRSAAELMGQLKIGSLLVEQGGEFVGILTETDIVRKAVAKGLDLGKEKVGSITSKPVIALEQTRSPQDAFDLMGDARVRHIAVTERGKIRGIVSVRDLLLYFRKQSEPEMGID
jgi:CBS domain-containing protein